MAAEGSVFKATTRSISRCRARKTTPIPPLPRIFKRTYSPRIRLWGRPWLIVAAWYSVSLPLWTSSLGHVLDRMRRFRPLQGLLERCNLLGRNQPAFAQVADELLEDENHGHLPAEYILPYQQSPGINLRANMGKTTRSGAGRTT